jgi:uncharacterized protein (TIGR03083 family)
MLVAAGAGPAGTVRPDRYGAGVVADTVLDAFAGEARTLSAAVADEPTAAFGAASWCPPWTVGELFWHVLNGAGRVRGMLAEPEPPGPEPPEPGPPGFGLVTAAGYYQADRRFSAATNADRIATAQRGAAGQDAGGLRAAFDRAWRATLADCGAAPRGRRVLTRHGDVMLLTEFMRTRGLELAVHGLDLAAGLGRDPWLTDAAAGLVEELILPGPAGPGDALRRRLGWDRAVLLAKATGRSPVTGAEQRAIAVAGLHWLALG